MAEVVTCDAFGAKFVLFDNSADRAQILDSACETFSESFEYVEGPSWIFLGESSAALDESGRNAVVDVLGGDAKTEDCDEAEAEAEAEEHGVPSNLPPACDLLPLRDAQRITNGNVTEQSGELDPRICEYLSGSHRFIFELQPPEESLAGCETVSNLPKGRRCDDLSEGPGGFDLSPNADTIVWQPEWARDFQMTIYAEPSAL